MVIAESLDQPTEKIMTKIRFKYLAPPLLLACFAIAGVATVTIDKEENMEQSAEANKHDPQTDFDFVIGSWKIHNRRLKEPLTGSSSWVEFEGKSVARKIWGGRANIDEFEADSPTGRIQGLTLRLYDPKSQQWRLYWANSAKGILDVPMVGEFNNGRGEFYDQEIFEGKSIFVRYIWSDIKENSARWEQAFSPDGGKTWETNWIMELVRSK
jgi:hypothetical protein